MSVPARQAYLDGEFCGVRPDCTTSFSLIQTASDAGNAKALVFFLFDLLYLDGEAIGLKPLDERKEGLRALLSQVGSPLQYSDYQAGRGRDFYEHACALKLEGIFRSGRTRVNAGEKMHRRAGVKMHHGRRHSAATLNAAFQFDQ